MKQNLALVIRLWRRARQLRRDLCAAQTRGRQLEDQLARAVQSAESLEAEIKRMKAAHEEEGTRLRQQVLESSSKAAAEHYQAFKWSHDYKVMELHLAATTSERDLYLNRMRELSAQVDQLQQELESHRRTDHAGTPNVSAN